MTPEKTKWHSHNTYRKKRGLPRVTFEEWRRHYNAVVPSAEEREFRYRRLKERLKAERAATTNRAAELGILTPAQMKANTMEGESATKHMLDKMVRQEGGCHLNVGARRFGNWHSIGDGCFRRGNGR